MFRIEIEGTEIVWDCEESDSILRSALRQDIGVPYSCNVGSCANCKFTLIAGRVRHRRMDAPGWGPRDEARGRWLACQSVPQSDCTIKYPPNPKYDPIIPPEVQDAQLVETIRITHDIWEFRFSTPRPADFLPGQYALLHFDGIDCGRPYSMCNLPGDRTWNFQIKKVPLGEATGRLFDMLVGSHVKLDGPYSTAYLRKDSARPLVLVAGGSGLSPMVAIAKGAKEAGLLKDNRLHFYYGCRTGQDLFDPTEILGDLFSQISFTAVLSDENTPAYRKGFLHEAIAEDLGNVLPNHEIYFAGPAVMASSMQMMLHEAGVPRDQVHFDEFYQ